MKYTNIIIRRFEKIGGEVAQSVEQRTENPCVHSSILCLATIFIACIYPQERFINYRSF